jgi:hypothetical protein
LTNALTDVGQHERHHHRADDAHPLQVAPEGRVEQKRRNTPRQDVGNLAASAARTAG